MRSTISTFVPRAILLGHLEQPDHTAVGLTGPDAKFKRPSRPGAHTWPKG